MKLKLVFCTLIYSLLASCSTAKLTSFSAIPKPVVRINHDFVQGTGFLVNNHGLIVTARHVVDDSERGIIPYVYVMYNGKIYKGTTIAVDEQSDVALISISEYTPEYYELEEGAYKPFVLYGFPEDLNNRREYGLSGAIEDDRLELTGKICHGHSGGPVIDRLTNKVIGLTDFMLNNDDNASCGMVGGAINSREILRFIHSRGL